MSPFWPEVELGELVNFRTGKLDSNAAVEGGMYPFFTCSQQTYTIDKYAFDTEAILLAGNNANGVYPIKFYRGKFNAYQRTYIIESRRSDVLNRFMFYALQMQLSRMQSLSTGAATKFLTLTILKGLKISLPPLPTQRKIAAILSAYDDLIENNTRRVQVLEQMARALYREWFVEYRFPGHEQAEWVEDEAGRRPQGWEWVPINEVAPVVTRGVAPKYNEESEDLVINQKCIRDQRLSLDPARRHLSKVPPLKVLRFGDVLINSTGVGTLGRVAQVYQEPENLTVDTHVTIVRADPQKMALDYFGLALMELQPEFEAAGVGSTGQTELGRERIGSTPVLMPPLPLQKEFGERVQAMRQLPEQLLLRNANLRRTRDLLLPRLVSGTLDVSGLRVLGPGLEDGEVEGMEGGEE